MERAAKELGAARWVTRDWLRRRWVGRVLMYLTLTVLAALFTFPLYWMAFTALKPAEQTFSYPPQLIPSRLAWENFPAVFREFPFVRGFTNTIVIVAGVEIGRLLTASLAAYAFARLQFRGREVLFVLVLSTMMIPYYATLIPQYLVFHQLGWLDSNKPLIIPAFLGGDAFFIFLLRQFFRTIPQELDDAAQLDGCSTLGVYWRIILPLSVPALATVAIFTFMWTWNDFLGPMIYLNSSENHTLAIALMWWQRFHTEAGPAKPRLWSHIMLVSTMIAIPPILVFFFAQRYFIQGVVFSGLKG